MVAGFFFGETFSSSHEGKMYRDADKVLYITNLI